MDKNTVRRSVLESRLKLNPHYIKEASTIISSKFEDIFGSLGVFLFYMSIKNEVDTSFLIERFYDAGKQIYLPCIENENLVFRRFNGFDKICTGKFGVCEPAGEILSGHFDAIVTPAVAFDLKCSRLGYGKGYYDRFLSSVKCSTRIGFAYDFQIVESVYAEDFDEPVDIVVTEKRIINRL